MHVVLRQRTGERASPGQVGARLTERKLQPGKQMVASNVHRQPHGAAETSIDGANVKSCFDTGCNVEKVLKARDLESEVKALANQREERGGKAVLGCNVEKFLKARDLESEVKVPEDKKEDKEEGDYMFGSGRELHGNGPYDVVGRTKADSGLVALKIPLTQVVEP
nr:hypothetical protein CFP56_49546 [Quercus suber]